MNQTECLVGPLVRELFEEIAKIWPHLVKSFGQPDQKSGETLCENCSKLGPILLPFWKSAVNRHFSVSTLEIAVDCERF
jgi:hypothetical protein